MKRSAAILLEYHAAVDYCQPTLEEHDVTREVIDYIHEEGIQLDMRKSCWQSLSSSLTNALSLFQYLKNTATELLREHSNREALQKYLDKKLTKENLESQKPFLLNQSHMPNINDLRGVVDEIGIEDFRAYADNQVQNCIRGQERLDLVINRRFERGGQSMGLFESIIESQFDQDHNIELLKSAYVWGAKVEGYLLTRQTSMVYSQKKEIYKSMSNRKFRIISPWDVMEHIS